MSDKPLHIMTSKELTSLTSDRSGEIKLGQSMSLVSSLDELHASESKFVVFGIKEDIGIRANLGKGGSSKCWDWLIKALANVQSNSFLNGRDITILGTLQFNSLLEDSNQLNPSIPAELKELRKLTAQVDEAVQQVLESIVIAGKVPIIVGGGHNNAYGNIMGTSKALSKPINVLNIDPHADYRALEGRHSGNGFSYARERGYLNKYAVYGLHEGYNGEQMIQTFRKDPKLNFQTFEELLNLTEEEKYQRLLHTINWLGPEAIGLELDLDSITGFPVSALNPSGFTLNETRQLIRTTAGMQSTCYFHICEGSPGRANNDAERELLGKSISYLITDFIKASLGR